MGPLIMLILFLLSFDLFFNTFIDLIYMVA